MLLFSGDNKINDMSTSQIQNVRYAVLQLQNSSSNQTKNLITKQTHWLTIDCPFLGCTIRNLSGLKKICHKNNYMPYKPLINLICIQAINKTLICVGSYKHLSSCQRLLQLITSVPALLYHWHVTYKNSSLPLARHLQKLFSTPGTSLS